MEAGSMDWCAPRPSYSARKLRECLPLLTFLRNRLPHALTGGEGKTICIQRFFIRIDGKVRTDTTSPAGFVNVISTDKTGEYFRLICDTKGCLAVHGITPKEAKHKLCKVRKVFVVTKRIPHLVIHSAHTIRCPEPLIEVNDTIQIDLTSGKVTNFITFDTGNLCTVARGADSGRPGMATNRGKPPGSFGGVHVREASSSSFAAWLSNIFLIHKGSKLWISLPQGKGIQPDRAVGEMVSNDVLQRSLFN